MEDKHSAKDCRLAVLIDADNVSEIGRAHV